jgi:hypothetical protein
VTELKEDSNKWLVKIRKKIQDMKDEFKMVWKFWKNQIEILEMKSSVIQMKRSVVILTYMLEHVEKVVSGI